ncbi:MAG: hypothetical protein HYV09_09785 [Deltaproteobacteria bacterium]|nr:hypothetical protein [Deltaproteobacteria bacterium]
MQLRALLASAALLTSAALTTALTGCPSGSGGGPGSPQWPTASKITPQTLPPGVSWHGVWFINTAGTRGTMHILLSGGEDKFHGCWLAEDKHARATFTGTLKENVAMFDWTQKRVGFAGAPERVTAYLVLTPDAEGRHKVKGEYGADVSSDSGSPWEGIRQKNAEPKEDGCKLEEGDTLPGETKPLE